MDFKNLSKQAKKTIEQRGGTGAIKGDLQELAKIAKSKGSASEKAKLAAEALKTPGRNTPSHHNTPSNHGNTTSHRSRGR